MCYHGMWAWKKTIFIIFCFKHKYFNLWCLLKEITFDHFSKFESGFWICHWTPTFYAFLSRNGTKYKHPTSPRNMINISFGKSLIKILEYSKYCNT